MSALVDGAEGSRADMCINLRCYQALVAEQFLHAADIGAAIQEVRGKTVPQGMRRGLHLRVAGVLGDQQFHGTGTQGRTALTDEQGSGRRTRAHREVGLQGAADPRGHRTTG